MVKHTQTIRKKYLFQANILQKYYSLKISPVQNET